MNINPMELMKAKSDPQGYCMEMLKNNPELKNNSMVQEAMNNPNSAETIARNLAKTYGIDLSMFGIK